MVFCAMGKVRRSSEDLLKTMFGLALAISLATSSDAFATSKTRILFIGDSITVGLGVENDQVFHSLIGDWLGNDAFSIEVLGCGGAMLREFRPDAEANTWGDPAPFYGKGPCFGFHWYIYSDLVLAFVPRDIAVVMLGTNDALDANVAGSPSSAYFYREGIELFALQLLADGVGTVVLVPPPNLPVGFAGSAAYDQIEQYGEEIYQLCGALEGVVCGPDIYSILDPDLHFPLREDGVTRDLHPNALGHEIMAVEIFDTILYVPEPDLALLQISGGLSLALLSRRQKRRR